jgi:hypothetical protein
MHPSGSSFKDMSSDISNFLVRESNPFCWRSLYWRRERRMEQSRLTREGKAQQLSPFVLLLLLFFNFFLIKKYIKIIFFLIFKNLFLIKCQYQVSSGKNLILSVLYLNWLTRRGFIFFLILIFLINMFF